MDPSTMGFSDKLSFLFSGNKPVDVLEPIRNYFTELILYLPNTLVLFGPLVDTINQDFRYTIASLIGIVSVLINAIISKIYTLFAGTTIATSMGSSFAVGCTVPGFELLESLIAPQAIVLINSILAYLIIDFTVSENKVQGNLGILWTVLFALHSIAMYKCNCFSNYNFGIFSLVLGVLLGAVFGIAAYFIMNRYYPEKLPSVGFVEKFVSGNVIKSKKDTSAGTTPTQTCPAPAQNDLEEDEYLVGELYKNGQPVLS